jgi:hypothetical protein
MSTWLVRAGAKSALSCRFSSTTIRDTYIGRGGLSYQLINFPYYYNRLHESLDAPTISGCVAGKSRDRCVLRSRKGSPSRH